MSTRQRTGVILLLVGVGIPLMLFPFGDQLYTIRASVSRMNIRLWETKPEQCVAPQDVLVCTPPEYYRLPYRYVFALGVVLVLSGLGALILPKVGDKKGEAT
jgi:uncharacterized protein YjeT (DUF2065 family)